METSRCANNLTRAMSASMRVEWGEPSPERRSILAHLWMRFESLHDLMFADASKLTLKHLAIGLSIAGFAIHLTLILLAHTLAHPPLLIALAGQNYLAAISTPFNFILFYEVLTLIAALPASTTRSIANQYESSATPRQCAGSHRAAPYRHLRAAPGHASDRSPHG
jgi:hypothetical protein